MEKEEHYSLHGRIWPIYAKEHDLVSAITLCDCDYLIREFGGGIEIWGNYIVPEAVIEMIAPYVKAGSIMVEHGGETEIYRFNDKRFHKAL